MFILKTSIIIPTYNESGNIEKLVNKINELVSDHEIIVVDDGSTDGTAEIIDRLDNVKPIHRKEKGGIFSALQAGIHQAQGDLILTMDADFSHPPEKLPEMIKWASKYDVVSGSRYIKGGDMNGPGIRSFGSKLINFVSRKILGIKVKDITGDFHLIHKGLLEDIEYKFENKFGEFNMEFFYRAKQKGLSVKEVPFVYHFRKEGESKAEKQIMLGLHYIKRAWELSSSPKHST